jgi:uncharacterized protein (TIGR02996 family)
LSRTATRELCIDPRELCNGDRCSRYDRRVLDHLRDAIDAADWGRALGIALDWWRATRAVELANLIDVLGARCTLPVPPRRELQAWWMLHASTYNPVAVTALAQTASDRADRSERTWGEIRAWFAGNPVIARLVDPHAETLETHRFRMNEANRIERLAVMASWPDDPRTATILARWLVEASIRWSRRMQDTARAFYELLAEQLVAIGDARVDEVLASTVAEPRGKTPELRALQSELARRVIAGVAERAAPLDDAAPVHAEMIEQLGRWCVALAPEALEPRPVEEDALWDDIGRNPEDLGPRLVLADYLIERGDPRGELIVLQCNAQSRFAAGHLIAKHWSTWLGDAGLVLDRTFSEFRNGMLEVVEVGDREAPDWAYDKVHGHRELSAVHTARPSYAVTPERFIEFLLDLERVPQRIGITHAIAEALRTRAPWPVRAVEYDYKRFGGPRVPSIDRTLELVAQAAPDIEELVIRTDRADTAWTCALVPDLPKLTRVVLEAKDWRWEGGRDAFAWAPEPATG